MTQENPVPDTSHIPGERVRANYRRQGRILERGEILDALHNAIENLEPSLYRIGLKEAAKMVEDRRITKIPDGQPRVCRCVACREFRETLLESNRLEYRDKVIDALNVLARARNLDVREFTLIIDVIVATFDAEE